MPGSLRLLLTLMTIPLLSKSDQSLRGNANYASKYGLLCFGTSNDFLLLLRSFHGSTISKINSFQLSEFRDLVPWIVPPLQGLEI